MPNSRLREFTKNSQGRMSHSRPQEFTKNSQGHMCSTAGCRSSHRTNKDTQVPQQTTRWQHAPGQRIGCGVAAHSHTGSNQSHRDSCWSPPRILQSRLRFEWQASRDEQGPGQTNWLQRTWLKKASRRPANDLAAAKPRT